jgi:hypothetical protein
MARWRERSVLVRHAQRPRAPVTAVVLVDEHALHSVRPATPCAGNDTTGARNWRSACAIARLLWPPEESAFAALSPVDTAPLVSRPQAPRGKDT